MLIKSCFWTKYKKKMLVSISFSDFFYFVGANKSKTNKKNFEG